MTVGDFWTEVTMICHEFDGSVTSGIRSAKRNEQVGGAGLSWHKYGLAADVVLDDWTNRPKFLERAHKVFPFVLDEGDHIHLQGRK